MEYGHWIFLRKNIRRRSLQTFEKGLAPVELASSVLSKEDDILPVFIIVSPRPVFLRILSGILCPSFYSTVSPMPSKALMALRAIKRFLQYHIIRGINKPYYRFYQL